MKTAGETMVQKLLRTAFVYWRASTPEELHLNVDNWNVIVKKGENGPQVVFETPGEHNTSPFSVFAKEAALKKAEEVFSMSAENFASEQAKYLPKGGADARQELRG